MGPLCEALLVPEGIYRVMQFVCGSCSEAALQKVFHGIKCQCSNGIGDRPISTKKTLTLRQKFGRGFLANSFIEHYMIVVLTEGNECCRSKTNQVFV